MKKSILTTAVIAGALSAGAYPPHAFRSPMGGRVLLAPDSSAEGVLPEVEFQKRVLAGVEAANKASAEAKTNQEKLLSDFDRLDKSTKSIIEDLTKVKNTTNDQALIVAGIQKAQIALRHEERAAFGDPIARISANEELRERLNCAVRLAMDSNGDLRSKIAPRLKALGEDASPGSTLINTALWKEIYDLLAMYGVWATLGVEQMGTKLTKMPIDTADPIAYVILEEGGEIADDANSAGSTVTLEVELIAVLLNVSLQLLQDSEFDVTGRVLKKFRNAFNKRLDFLAFRGDGTANSTHGGMTGIFNFFTAAACANGNTLIENTDLDDWIRVYTTVDEVVLERNPKWWMSRQNLARTVLVRDENGRPLFQTALEVPNPKAIGSILGAPVVLSSICPNTNAAAAQVAAFGDPEAMAVGIRQDFEFAVSDHHKWNTFQRSFRGIGRAGVKGRIATGGAVLTLAAA